MFVVPAVYYRFSVARSFLTNHDFIIIAYLQGCGMRLDDVDWIMQFSDAF